MKKIHKAFQLRILILASLILGTVLFFCLSTFGVETAGLTTASLSFLPFMAMIRTNGPGRLNKTKEEEESEEYGAGYKDLTEKEKSFVGLVKAMLLKQLDKWKTDNKGGTENYESLKTLIGTLSAKTDLETLKTELNAMGLKLNAIQEKPAVAEPKKSFVQAFTEAWTEKKTEIDAILAANGKQQGPLRLEVKSAVTMQVDNTVEAGGSASQTSITSNTGIISAIRKRILTYLSNVAIGGISVDMPWAMWIEELDEQGAPIFIGEGDSKTELSVRYEERRKRSKKIAVFGKVTTEMMRYLPQLIAYIQNNLVRRMDIKTEDQLFNGDDTGDNLKGLIPYATAFDGGVGTAGGPGLVGLVPTPTNWDVIRAIALQVFNSYGVAGKLFLTPDAMATMEVSKDANGNYIMPPFMTADGRTVAGMQLVPTNALVGTGYDFVGGDMSVVNVAFLEQTGIQIGLDGNDFTKNKKTILVEQELVQFVSANDIAVLVYGDFASAKTILEAVVIP